MKKALASILSVVMLSAFFPQQEILAYENAIEIYVAPDGNDLAAGTIDSPLATLEGAKEKVRKVKKNGVPVNVYFREGEYFFADSVEFYERDSGSKGAPVTYMAYGDETPKFSGAVAVETEDFKSVTDEMYERIPEISRDYVGVVDLKEKGVKPLIPFTAETSIGRSSLGSEAAIIQDAFVEFYFNDRAMSLAAWPNGERNYARLTKVKSQTEFGGDFGDRMKNWVTAENAMIAGFLGLYDYGEVRAKIIGYNLQDETLIFTEGDYGPGYFGNPTPKNTLGVAPDIGGKYRVENLIEELDVPGEYYLDYDDLKLYFYPPYSTVGVDMRLAIGEKPLVSMNKTEYVTFKGITFEKNRENMIELTATDHIQFLSCRLWQFALRAIDTNGSCHNTLIDGCDFFMGGCIAVQIGKNRIQDIDLGNYDSVHLVQQNNVINNSHFWNMQNQFSTTKASGAIALHEVGSTVSNSRFHDTVGNVISWSGNDHKFLNNELHNVMKHVHDQGAIYNGRSKIQYGIEIANSYFHDCSSSSDTAGTTNAVYLDDTLSGGNVHHNIFANIESAFDLRGGPDTQFDHNIIVENSGINYYEGNGMKTSMIYNYFVEFSQAQIPMVYTLDAFQKYKNMFSVFFGTEWPNYGSTYIGNLFYNNKIKYPTVHQGAALVGISNDNQWFCEPDEAKKIFNNMEEGDYTINPDYNLPKEYQELKNIKLDEIGTYASETREAASDPLSDFNLYYPYNFCENISGQDVYLRWEPSIGADYYLVDVAFDEKFEKIVETYTSQRNYLLLDELDNGKTEYFWRVTAVANGKDCKEKKLNSGGPKRFITQEFDILDKSKLIEKLKAAEEFLPQFTEGVEGGNVAYGSTNNLKKYIEKAKLMLEMKKGLQTDIDALTNLLDREMFKIGNTVTRTYTGIDSIIAAKNSWVHNTEAEGLTHLEDGIQLGNTHGHIMTVYTNTAAPIERNKLFCFKLNIDIPDGASGGKWQAIGFQRKQDAGIRLYDGTKYGYLFLIKNSTIEVQLWNGSKQRIIGNIPNTLPKGVDSDVKFGVLDFGPGQTIILEVNGETVFEHAEYTDLLRDDLYFSVYDSPIVPGELNTKPLKVKVADAEDIPASDIGLGDELSLGVNDMTVAISSISGGTEAKISNGAKLSDQKMDNLKSIDFSIKPVLSDKDQGILFRVSDEEFDENKSEHYKLSFKNNKLILYKLKDGIKQTMAIEKTDAIKSNEWNDIRLYTCYESGSVRIIVYVGEDEIINCLDIYPVKGTGYFGIFNNSSSELIVKP